MQKKKKGKTSDGLRVRIDHPQSEQTSGNTEILWKNIRDRNRRVGKTWVTPTLSEKGVCGESEINK